MSGLSAQWLWFFDDQLVHGLREVNPGDSRVGKRAASHPAVVRGVRLYLEGRAGEALSELAEAVDSDDTDAIALTGQIQFELGCIEDAARSFTRLMERDPNHPCAMLNLGLCQARMRHWAEAIGSLQRALLLHPDRAEVWFALGVCLMNEDRVAESRAAFAHSLRLEENYAPALFGQAVCLHMDGKPGEALAAYERLLEGQPGREQILVNALAAAAEARNAAKTREYASRLLQMQPRSIEPHLALAFVALRDGNVEEAATHCERAGNLMATLFEHHYNLGLCWLELRRFHLASVCFENAVRMRPHDAGANEGLAMALTGLGRESEARQAWMALLEQHPDRTDAWFQAGLLAADSGHAEEAVEAFATCVRLKPDWLEAWNNLGSAHWAAGDLSQAREAFQRVMDVSPFQPVARRSMAALAAASGDSGAAERYLDGLTNVDWQVLYNLAALHHGEGNLERSAQLYRQVLRMQPDAIEARFNLGSVLFGLGRIDESQGYWKSAVAARPELASHFLGWIGSDPLAATTPTL